MQKVQVTGLLNHEASEVQDCMTVHHHPSTTATLQAFQKSATIFKTDTLWCLASFPAETGTSWAQVQGKVVPRTPVGALTSCFWLWGGGDVLRGQDLGEAHGSANPLSQVGGRWVVGAHAVLGADGVVSLHALHLSGERNATAACESQASVPWGYPAIPSLHGFEGGHSGCMESKTLTRWPWVFDLVGLQSARTDQLQVVWYEM